MTAIKPSWELVKARRFRRLVLAGVDEVGRGAWAGPVVAGAVILPYGLEITGLADSKQVSVLRRRQLDRHIRAVALATGLGWVSPAEVDAHGLTWAVRESGQRALMALEQAFDHVLLDGKYNYLDGLHSSEAIIKADALLVPVAAASILAKVARDRYMELCARRHPNYGFESHKGYGTRAHQAALTTHGSCPLHRLTYAPLQKVINVG